MKQSQSSDHVPSPGKKVLLVVPEIFDTMGGISRVMRIYLLALCELAAGKTGSVNLVALNDAQLDTTDLHKYSNNKFAAWAVCGRSKKRFIQATIKIARRSDVVICGHIAQLPVVWFAKQLNRRMEYYVIAHGIEAWRPFTILERLALRGAKKVISVSDYTRQELLKHCPLKEGRAIVVPNALDPYFQIATDPTPLPQAPVILCISRLSKEDSYKGVGDLIAAIPKIKAEIPDVQLRICGRGDNLRFLQDLAKSRNVLNKGVTFVGFVDDATLVQEIKGSRLFALPSQKEGFGLVYLEAMAQGRPCLAASAGGAPEVVSQETGVLVPFGDTDAIASASIKALRKDWPLKPIVDRASYFSYNEFKKRLSDSLR